MEHDSRKRIDRNWLGRTGAESTATALELPEQGQRKKVYLKYVVATDPPPSATAGTAPAACR
jgi:hypothetical protein